MQQFTRTGIDHQRLTVFVDESFVSIALVDDESRIDADNEIVRWVEDEWKEEPELASTIAGAVAHALTYGAYLAAHLVGKQVMYGPDGKRWLELKR